MLRLLNHKIYLDFNEICGMLRNLYEPPTTVNIERFRFYNLLQQPNQRVIEFVFALRQQATKCSFGEVSLSESHSPSLLSLLKTASRSCMFPLVKTSFSNLSLVMLARLGLRTSPAVLNMRSTAAELGKAVLYLMNSEIHFSLCMLGNCPGFTCHLAPAPGVHLLLDELPNVGPILLHDSGALQEGKWVVAGFLRLFCHHVLALAGGERVRCDGGDDLPDEPLLDVFFKGRGHMLQHEGAMVGVGQGGHQEVLISKEVHESVAKKDANLKF
ncbi:hypothetical protein GWK47_048807 [Chionoecetes opilio]|uniref:Uncharacterized protein n=1 Tax=Chionoecetes opilio TaxID=41210 RepID=A0A8J4Y9X9_CHIOP|nr:hypothetical protein GWK47_048807 [Chionoecetes opilio]